MSVGPGTVRGRAALPKEERNLLIILAASAVATALLILWAVQDKAVAAGFAAAILGGGALLHAARLMFPMAGTSILDSDWSLVREAADNDEAAIAVTDRTGRLVCANALYEGWFGGPVPPARLAEGEGSSDQLTQAGKLAWRDGRASVTGLRRDLLTFDLEVIRSGRSEDHLVWRMRATRQLDLIMESKRLISGTAGERMGEAGMMAVLMLSDGKIASATPTFAVRATGKPDISVDGSEFVSLLETDKHGAIRFSREGRASTPLRLMQVPLDRDDPDSPTIIILIDDRNAVSGTDSSVVEQVQGLLAALPLGLALTDRDGRFLFLNDAFSRAAGVPQGASPIYPSDLVVKDDKAPLADTIRRFATGQTLTGDIAIRLRESSEEPVALSVAGLRGLGEAAVLLSLKDNSEESKLKRQIAQASKMQAVGQLAGGVAHDFNNILTGILGHCDLMLMRHTPGDSDYDDIQQIKNNSNRAAALTRQLLAFSRQQTLRPQIIQMADSVAEISNLLKRLLGETVTLEVKHGRNVGPVRADPGQLEQVIVNLAVNARDAMPRGGVMTIQTYSVSKSDVRKLGTDILPVAEYSALSLSDTGTGIAPELITKIFEPFFTTKEVGRGTGLGLSTVYGIVKQSGGFIFADSTLGVGTSFVIYLPVHAAEAVAQTAPRLEKERPTETWGSGTILLVEDEDMVRAVAERALTRNGYTVLTATNGEEALEILDSHPGIDLLLSDVVMPVMDGPTMVRQARAKFPDLPVLFMSGYAEEQLRKTIDLDRMAFLPKPFAVQQLAEAVRTVMPARDKA
jgi:two-component system, cell cycle sensor histidine kinase and response regulator CckA